MTVAKIVSCDADRSSDIPGVICNPAIHYRVSRTSVENAGLHINYKSRYLKKSKVEREREREERCCYKGIAIKICVIYNISIKITAWSSVLFEKLVVSQLVKKFRASYRTERHCSLASRVT
jgi:hypothetical protein